MVYHREPFTEEERAVLGRFFTNPDGPVFALINLPEVVKGALFARYSRTHKSLRRLFLDEFVTDASVGIAAIAAEMDRDDPLIKLKRAEDLYRRVFYEYGDDSVAQLGGVHLACEQASNLLTKVLEWGRLAAYLEQSTRYIGYDQPLGGRYRFFLPPEIEELASAAGVPEHDGSPVRHLPRHAPGDDRILHQTPPSPEKRTPNGSITPPSGPRPSTPSGGCCLPPPSPTWAYTPPVKPTKWP